MESGRSLDSSPSRTRLGREHELGFRSWEKEGELSYKSSLEYIGAGEPSQFTRLVLARLAQRNS